MAFDLLGLRRHRRSQSFHLVVACAIKQGHTAGRLDRIHLCITAFKKQCFVAQSLCSITTRIIMNSFKHTIFDRVNHDRATLELA